MRTGFEALPMSQQMRHLEQIGYCWKILGSLELFISLALLVVLSKNAYMDEWIVFLSLGCICALSICLIASGHFVIFREGSRLALPGGFAIFWGIVHTGPAVLILYFRNPPGPLDELEYSLLIVFPALASLLILSGIYVLGKRIYTMDSAFGIRATPSKHSP
jgi:hypothetical protein